LANIQAAESDIPVPAQYQQLIEDAAQATGIPYNVVAAQVQDESGFDPDAVSSADAEGMFQFLPTTYNDVASQAGVQPGTEFNPDDEEKAYVVYMNQLLSQEGGSIQRALEAYNAGPGNLTAGAGYADSILAAAGENPTASASSGSNVTSSPTGSTGSAQETSSLNIFELFGIPFAGNPVSNIADQAIADSTNAAWKAFMGITGVSGMKDLMIRVGLLIIGLVIFIVALAKFLDVHPVELASTAAKGI
jgi:hypothetical protein